MSEWLWEEHKKVLFFYTAELGGFSARVEQRIRQGLIRPFRMRTRDDVNNSLSFETMHLSSKGYVPARFVDALAGEVEPGVPMIAPVITLYSQQCPNCGHVFATRFKAKITSSRPCDKCKKPVLLAAVPPQIVVKQTPGFEAIGTMGYDGLTSFSDWYLQDMSHRKNLEGEKAAIGGDIVSGDMVFRGNNRSQVGMAQTRVHELVANSLGIPNLVVMPVWTAITHESSDDTGRLQIVGPKLAGDAKTYIAASWFGNVVEADVVTNDKGEYIRRLYVSQFYDEYNRRHLCGHRGDPRFMPIHLDDDPYSDEHPPVQMCTGFSLATFQRTLEESIRKGIEADTGLKDTPGTSAIPQSYGDAEDIEAAVAQVAATSSAAPAAPKGAPVARRPAAQKPKGTPAPVAPPAPTAAPQETAAPPAEETPAPDEAASTEVEETEPTPPQDSAGDGEPAADAGVLSASTTTETQPEVPAPSPAEQPAQTAAAQTAAPVQAAAGAWTRPAGNRPQAPRAPQSGPKPPATRTAPRPVTAVKPS